MLKSFLNKTVQYAHIIASLSLLIYSIVVLGAMLVGKEYYSTVLPLFLILVAIGIILKNKMAVAFSRIFTYIFLGILVVGSINPFVIKDVHDFFDFYLKVGTSVSACLGMVWLISQIKIRE